MARRRPTEPTANPARGVALVVVAVLVGLFLLRNGIDSSTTSTSSSTDGSSTDGGTSGTDGDSNSTTSTLGLRSPAEVPLIVLNGSGVSGAAKKYSTALLNKGYTNLTKPDGDNSTLKPATTAVYYASGFENEASAVASAIGAPATGVAPAPTASPGDIAGASVVVVLGTDLGSKDPPA
jgi:hypothetical protein